MKFWMIVAALLCMVLPVQAKKVKTPRSHNASGYKPHKAPKITAHKMTRSQKNKYKNRIN